MCRKGHSAPAEFSFGSNMQQARRNAEEETLKLCVSRRRIGTAPLNDLRGWNSSSGSSQGGNHEDQHLFCLARSLCLRQALRYLRLVTLSYST